MEVFAVNPHCNIHVMQGQQCQLLAKITPAAMEGP